MQRRESGQEIVKCCPLPAVCHSSSIRAARLIGGGRWGGGRCRYRPLWPWRPVPYGPALPLLFDCGGVSGLWQWRGIPTEHLMTVAVLSGVGRRDGERDTGTLRVVPVVSMGSGSGSAMRAMPGSLCGPSPGVCPLKNATSSFLVRFWR